MENSQWVPQEIVKPTQNPPLPVVNQGSVPPTVPNANPKKNLPWFLWLLAGCGCLVPPLIIMLIVIVAINPAARIREAKERAAQVASRSATTAVNTDTTGWITYTSKKWGFQINHPKEWTNNTIEDTTGVRLMNQEGANLDAVVIDFDFTNSTSVTSNYNKIKAFEINKEVVNWNGYSENLTRISNSTLNGFQTIRYKIASRYTENGLGNSTNYGVFFMKDNKIYQIDELYGQDATNATLIFDQILSTFKFI